MTMLVATDKSCNLTTLFTNNNIDPDYAVDIYFNTFQIALSDWPQNCFPKGFKSFQQIEYKYNL